MHFMRRMLIGMSAMVVIAGVSVEAFGRAQPFEGTTWKVTVTPDPDAANAGEEEFTDTLVFKGGKFTAQECAKHGFGPVDYHEEMAAGGHTANFTAEPVSEKEGKAKWRGTVMASEMRGEMTWTKKDGTVMNYTFRGERVSR